MIFPVYAYRDLTQGFGTLVVNNNDESMKRQFGLDINNNPLMNYAAKDFDLFKIGEYNTENGTIKGDLPVLICKGIDVYQEKK